MLRRVSARAYLDRLDFFKLGQFSNTILLFLESHSDIHLQTLDDYSPHSFPAPYVLNASAYLISSQPYLRTNAVKILKAIPDVGLRPYLLVVPHPRPPGVRSGVIIPFNAVVKKPIPYVSFNIPRPSSTYDAIVASKQFRVYPVHDLTTFSVFEDSSEVDEVTKWRFIKQQQRALSKAPWQIRCRLSPGKCVGISHHEIMVGKVLAVLSHERSPMNYASLHLRRIGGQYHSLDAFTSYRFEARLGSLQRETRRLENDFSELKKSSELE